MVIGGLEDAEDYQAFEAAITADYGAQSAVERDLVLRLASLLRRLRRATIMETGLFDVQADSTAGWQWLPLIHPSEILRNDFLSMKIDQRLHINAGDQGGTTARQHLNVSSFLFE